MNNFRLYLLGPFRATLAGQAVQGFAYNKVRALLAYLAVESQYPHSRETLATLLWPEADPDAARASLRKALSTLRKALHEDSSTPAPLIVQRDTVYLNPDAGFWVDVAQVNIRLDAVLAQAQSKFQICDSCVHDLEEAAAIYRGGFLQGLLIDSLEFEEWSLTIRENLHTRMLTALHELTQHYLRLGEYTQAQKYALRQVTLEPYREEAHRALMQSLAHSGQRSAALAQYERCRSILAEALGVPPSRETQALYRRIRSAGEERPHNLPLRQTQVIGRQPELQEIGKLLAHPECCLVTLVGIGGIGKTSLALQAAHERLGDFLHGAFWVRLESLTAPEQVLDALIQALQLSRGSDPETQLLDYLREKSVLLVLDNFEHLIPAERGGNQAALDLIGKILASSPHVKFLVTSRQRLSLRAEWVLQIEGLPYPQHLSPADVDSLPGYAAIQLFMRRTRQVGANLTPTPHTYLQIAHICRFLQGVPLGIELAAAWADHFTYAEIAAQIETSLDFLATSLHDLPDRHQSLRAVFEHSWNLLPAEEQMILRKLAVFQGNFSRDAAREISGAAQHHLAALVNKSFLRHDASGRYHLHPLLKQFSLQILATNSDENHQTQNAHAVYFARFLQEREYALAVQNQKAALEEVGESIADLQAAWDWAIASQNLPLLQQALEGLFIYYWARNQFTEGQSALEQAAQMISISAAFPENQLVQARLQSRIADFIYWQDDLEAAEALLLTNMSALQALSAPDELAYAQELLSRVYYWQGKYKPAKETAKAAIATARQAETPHHLAQALNLLASIICEESGDYETAHKLYAESLTIYRQLENPFGIAKTLLNQGAVFYEQGHLLEAQTHCEKSLEQYREIKYPFGISACLNNLAIIARKQGDFIEAKELILESLALKRETGNNVSILHALLEISALLIETENYAEACGHLREALQLAEQTRAGGFIFNIVIGFADLYSQTGAKQRAAELLAWVLSQENLGQEAAAQAKKILTRIEQLNTSEFSRCQEQGRQRTADEIIVALSCEQIDII